MATIDITEENFNETVTQDGIVVVDFWADWCGPCKRFAPIFEASSEANPEIVHAKVDSDANPELSATFGITSIPTIMAFRDGVMVFQQAGALPGPALKQLIDAVADLDMDEVREQIAQQQ